MMSTQMPSVSPTPSILVTRRLPALVEAALEREFGAVLNPDDRQLTGDELRAALDVHDILLCTLTDRLAAEVLGDVPRRAGLLANFGAGTNHIDLRAAREAGLAVTNTPGVLTDDTADLTMLLILAVARRLREGDRELRAGEWAGWRPTHLLGTRVTGATLGIVGFGRIGQGVAKRAARGFGMRVLYHSRHPRPAEMEDECGATFVPALEALLAESDIVSLHCPATPETHHLMGHRELRLMRPTAFLVNTARGDVVDEAALVAALADGTIAGAGLDVFEREPFVPEALRTLPNVVALPHLGSATEASRVAMGMCALANIRAFVRGEPLPNRVA